MRLLPSVVRRLIRARGFTPLSVLVVAIGIAALTTVFSVVDAVLLHPLPYPDSERLVGVWHKAPGIGVPEDAQMSLTQWVTYSEENRAFQSLGLWTWDRATVRDGDRPRELAALRVTAGTLDALGVAPAIGRWFARRDDDVASEATVILTHAFWQRAFGGDRNVIGRVLTLNDRSSRIIGVMPEDFEFLDRSALDVILPFRFDRRQLELGNFNYQGLARLRPGVSLAAANADVARMLPGWLNAWPTPPGIDRALIASAKVAPDVRPLSRDVIGDVGPTLWILFGTVGLVLLIACANIANLFLVRSEHRLGELSIRLALGAAWQRLAGDVFNESLAIATAGALLGLGGAAAALRLLIAFAPDTLPRAQHIAITADVVVFAAVVTFLASVLIACAPMVRLRRLTSALHARTITPPRSSGQRLLLVVQVALAVLLMIGAGLMVRTFTALRAVHAGFTRPETIELLHVSIPDRELADSERAIRVAAAMRDNLAALPGVESVAFASSAPLEPFASTDPVFTEDHPLPQGVVPPVRGYRFVSPGTFDVMGTRLVAGRDVSWDDLYQRHRVVLVSDGLARELWGSADLALHKKVRSFPGEPWREVVGVVEDVHDEGLGRPASKVVYWPALMDAFGGDDQFAARTLTFIVRSRRAGSSAFVEDAARAVASVDANLPVTQVRTLDELYRQSLARTSFTLLMLAIAAVIALLLSVVGLYAVVAYAVTRRTREIGIRMALGAHPGAVRALFVRDAATLAGAGAVIGAAAAGAATRWMTTLLFGVSPLDPATYAIVALTLMAIAAIAASFPAQRAASIAPLDAIREQ